VEVLCDLWVYNGFLISIVYTNILVMCTSGNLYECEEEWEDHWAKQELERKKALLCAYSGLPNMDIYRYDLNKEWEKKI
tara:strand:+ start:294 stop:530 length:237 start_codon:yes stop_codon:yes gene_type:complete